jgi:hypothetical protein
MRLDHQIRKYNDPAKNSHARISIVTRGAPAVAIAVILTSVVNALGLGAVVLLDVTVVSGGPVALTSPISAHGVLG